MSYKALSGATVIEKRVRDLVASLGAGWSYALAMPAAPREPYGNERSTQTNAEVARHQPWLFEPSPEMLRAIAMGMRPVLARGFNVGAAKLAGGSAWRSHLMARAEGRTLDVRPPPITADWRERKARLGLNPNPGRASGQLLRAIKSARVELSR